MATAGTHKIIIEQGADFVIDVQVSENGVVHKDLTGYTPTMVIKYKDDAGLIQTLDTIVGVLVPDVGSDPATYFDGYFKIVIDKLSTASYPTRVPSTYDPFATSYEYYYHIDISGPNSDDIRVLRGKLAVRL